MKKNTVPSISIPYFYFSPSQPKNTPKQRHILYRTPLHIPEKQPTGNASSRLVQFLLKRASQHSERPYMLLSPSSRQNSANVGLVRIKIVPSPDECNFTHSILYHAFLLHTVCWQLVWPERTDIPAAYSSKLTAQPSLTWEDRYTSNLLHPVSWQLNLTWPEMTYQQPTTSSILTTQPSLTWEDRYTSNLLHPACWQLSLAWPERTDI